MEAEELDAAPLWTNLRTFDGGPWRGVVDCVAGGFPCQPHSTAGKRKGEADDRNLWPDVARIVGEVQPRAVFFENVPGLVSTGDGEFFRAILEDLERMGYEVAAGLFTADEVGASHRRQRLFVVGVAQGDPEERNERGNVAQGERGGRGKGKARRTGAELGDSNGSKRRGCDRLPRHLAAAASRCRGRLGTGRLR